MELNFNSVETVPSLNASAAFQVDSGKVFKEDTDIVPTVIDDTLSYMPWGGDNAMPYNILKLIEDDETLSTCQMFNAEVCYGSGIQSSMPSIEDWMMSEERTETSEYRRIKKEVEDFTLDNALPSYFLGVCQDFKQLDNLLTLGNVQASLTLRSLNRRFRLLRLGHHPQCRRLEDRAACTQGGLLLPTLSSGERRRNPPRPLRQLAAVGQPTRGHRGH